MGKRYFTVKEAKALLPMVREKINRLQELIEQSELIESVKLDFNDYYKSIVSGVQKQKEMSVLQLEFYSIIHELVKQSIVMRDIEMGLVDFYAKHEDREIFLCWQIGEKTICSWHEIGSCFDERKPIALLKQI